MVSWDPDQSSSKSLKACYGPMPAIMPNFIMLSQIMYEISVTIFYTLQYFGTPAGLPGIKFTNLGPDVLHGQICQCAKFRLILTTCIQDICCQSSPISLTA